MLKAVCLDILKVIFFILKTVLVGIFMGIVYFLCSFWDSPDETEDILSKQSEDHSTNPAYSNLAGNIWHED